MVGSGDEAKLTDPALNLSAAFGVPMVSPPADVVVRDGDVFSAAGFDLEVRAIPGHSQGHVIYLWREHQPMLAFVGDVIFSGSVGRTDFPDGDFNQLTSGIRAKLFTLPDDTMLLPGHGPSTTVGKEKRSNPFVGRAALRPLQGLLSNLAIADIAGMRVTRWCSDGREKWAAFTVPRNCWGEILGALTPSEKDRWPAKWMVLADLEIQTKEGLSCWVGLYFLPDEPVGAFSARPSFEERVYYRGGNSDQLRDAVARAYAESVKQITDSAEAPGNSR